MRAARSAQIARRWVRLTIAFSLAISVVAIPIAPALAATDTYADDFSFEFSGNSGSLPWATDWIEWGEADGASAGALVVGTEPNCPGGGTDPCLIIGKGGPAEVALEREVDLSRATTATLEFSMTRHIHPAGTHGTVELSVSGNGGTDWFPLETWDLSVDPGLESKSYDLAGHLGPNTRIKFRQYGGASDSHINIDDLVITAENDLSVYAGGIMINEVLFDQSPGGGGEDEFVELYNATTSVVSLDGWELQRNTGSSFYVFPGGVSLAPGEYAVIWIVTYDPGGLRDAPAAAFQDGAGEASNFLSEGGDAIWLYDDGGFRVDFVAWGGGIGTPPPEWDATYESAIGGSATARGQSISLTPDGVDGNDSACWEPTTSGEAAGRCAGYLPTGDIDPAAQLWTPGVSNQGPSTNNPPVFDQDLADRTDSEGTLISVSATATDPDIGDTLTYTATGLPEGISLNPGTGLLTGALGPNAAGSHAVTITVTDDGAPNLTDIDTFTWTVTPGEVAYLVANTGGGNGGDDLLTAVDLTDPNPATNEINIGTGTGTTNIESIALQPGTDTLFAIENNQLGTIDLTTGLFTALPSIVGSGNGPAGLITFDNIESLTFNPYTGHLYATHRRGDYNEDLLFRIDPATGAAIPGMFGSNDYTPIQRAGLLYHMADMAFDPTDGQLYGIHWTLLGSFGLATVDPATGATTSIGALPTNVTGLALSDTGGLWGTTADTPSPYFLYEFDKTNASVLSTTVIDNAANYEAIAISFPFNPNLPPVFDQDLLDRSDPEGTLMSLSAAGTDPDFGDVLLYTATGLPPGLTINPGSGLITGTTSFTATGTYSVVITTTDNGIPNLTDTDTFTWTITEVNKAPVFDQDLLDRSDAEGTLISLSAAATDPDPADTITYTAAGLPAGLTIDLGSGLITGTLTFTASGTYPITITVSDDGIPGLTDTDTFTWTVADTNRPPVIVNPGAQTTPELAPFTLVITASDPDLTIPGFSDGGTLPAWATLTDNLDGTATISGTPGGGDSATTTVTISADDGLLSDDAIFDLTVTNTNLAPVMVNPGDQSGAENTPFTLTVSATDPDTTIPNFTTTGLPGWATLTDNADGTATITGTPGFDDAGITTVTVTASDGSLTDDAIFTIDIANTNRAPIVAPIADQSVAEADPFLLVVSASDPDLTIPTLSAGGLPTWAGFTDNLDGTATITGTPGYTDATTHLITITADDGSLSATETFDLTITNTNRAPTIADPGPQITPEGALFGITLTASDPDGGVVTFTDGGTLPGWATLNDNGDNTASVSGTPAYTNAGITTMTVTVSDGLLTAAAVFDITVTNTNRPPVVDPTSDQSTPEAAPFTLTITGSDPDLTNPALTAAGLPAWATFTDNGNGTATLAGTPGYDDASSHSITVTADDGALTDDTTFTLTITNTNRPPVIDPVANQMVAEAAPLTPLTITATDPDLTIPALSAAGLPPWATFTDNGNGTATLAGTPGFTDSGATIATITASDGALTNDTAFTITVTSTNRAPAATDDALLVPSDALFTVFAVLGNDSDPDGDPISVIAFDPTTTGTLTTEGAGTFRYVPGSGAPYAETFSYTISDPGGATATATVFVSVAAPAALPPTPIVELPALIGLAPIFGMELEPITFTAGITLPADVRFALVDGPVGSAINPTTGGFAWTPTEAQGPGEYTFLVRIIDPAGRLLDEAAASVSVGERETAPTLRPSGPLLTEPGTVLAATFEANDPDLPARPPRFELAGTVPAGARINPQTGALVWDVPANHLIGPTELVVRAIDGSDPTLYDEMTITVTVGSASSSDRKAVLVAGLFPSPDEPPDSSSADETGVKRTLVIMARAGMGSARAFGAPFLLLALLTVLVISFGRISIHPLLGRGRRQGGTVAWFDGQSGYGFIIPDRSQAELFLHRSALRRGKTDVAPGERVTFRTVKGGQRSFALAVREEGQS